MSIEQLDYAALEVEVASALAAATSVVLATGAAGRVTARSMSPVNDGLDVYMQTDRRFLKVAQMRENPRVALCLGNISIEGAAEFLGHPMEEANRAFRELYSQKHKGSYERYSRLADEVVFVVRPVSVTIWKYVQGLPCRDRLDVQARSAFREFY